MTHIIVGIINKFYKTVKIEELAIIEIISFSHLFCVDHGWFLSNILYTFFNLYNKYNVQNMFYSIGFIILYIWLTGWGWLHTYISDLLTGGGLIPIYLTCWLGWSHTYISDLLAGGGLIPIYIYYLLTGSGLILIYLTCWVWWSHTYISELLAGDGLIPIYLTCWLGAVSYLYIWPADYGWSHTYISDLLTMGGLILYI